RTARRRAALALRSTEIDALRQAPGSNHLRPDAVEAILFGVDPKRDKLVRDRIDLLAALTKQEQRKAPVDARPGPPAVPAPRAPAAPMTSPQAVARMVDDAANGVVLPGQRATADSLSQQVGALSLHGGAADVTAFHDFAVLSVAFDHIWRTRLCADLVET